MHVLPRVAELHRRFEGQLVVIGVHAGKYPAERATERIRSACARLDVRHPVVNDRQFRIWREFDVNAWPTVVLVGADGRIVLRQAGEFDTESLAGTIAREIERFRAAGTLDEEPRDFGRDPHALAEPEGLLRFPGRVLARGEKLFVADTGHHRILEMELVAHDAAAIRRVFGSGLAGLGDGAADCAAFHSPQGLATDGTTLYVADRSNHAVRAVDLGSGAVTTLAGTGLIAESRPGPGPATAVALRSPWDVTLVEKGLLVAMAGSHQLWLLDLAAQRIAPYAGTGGEAIEDGPAREALLAQPMGLAGNQGAVAFADAESSSVRTLAMGDPGWVSTLVGTGLFDFGDVDGAGEAVRLQHAEAICFHDTRIMVADTYNDKIKTLDVDGATCRALPGAAGSGTAFSHPAGVTSDGHRLFVADTDAHRIVIVDPDSGSVSDLVITDGRTAAGDPQ